MTNEIKKIILEEKQEENNELLTMEEFRSIKGFEDIKKQDADELSEFINSIAEMLYKYEF